MNYRDCPHCLGTGRDPWAPMPCQVCKGQGQVRAFPKEQSVVCRYCKETGRDPYHTGPCPICHGHGVISAGPIEFVYISGSKPYSDRRTIENILEQTIGEVRICETYLGKGTLDLLKSLPETCTVRVLAGKIINISPREIETFNEECPSFEFRCRTQGDLHDRYLLDDRGLLILGHGLKDIGKRESFAIFLEKSSNPDIIRDILEAFNGRWKSATPVQS